MSTLSGLICVLCCLALCSAFRSFPNSVRLSKCVTLRMSDGPDPLEAIRQKMAADPSYNPMSDPQAMQVLESMIPEEMKDLPNAVERLKVAFTDATTGQEAIEDLDAVASEFGGDKKSLISTPTSAFFTQGLPEVDFNEATLDELFKKVREEHPDVPLE